MIFDIFLKILFTGLIFCGTTICGISLIFRFIPNARCLTKLILSFVIGYVFLSLSGIAANLLSIDVFTTELSILIFSIIGIIPLRKTIKIDLDRNDWIVLGLTAFYTTILISFFDNIVMWMAGDALVHGSIIRMLVDGQILPISISPLGSYWEIYPKGFHFFSYFWTKVSPLLTVIQVIPVIITSVTPLLIYCIVREMKKDELALLAFIFSAFCFSQHYVYLIWAGYPSAAAEMLLIGGVLILLLEKRLLPLILIGLLFTHPRYLGLFFGLILAWLGIWVLERKSIFIKRYLLVILMTIGIFLFLFVMIIPVHVPEFFLSIITNKQTASEYLARWFWGVLSFFGLIIAFYRRDILDKLTIASVVAIMGMAIFVDIVVLPLSPQPDRIIALLYIPFSIFAAYAVTAMIDSFSQIKTVAMILLIIIGSISMGIIFHSYAGSWGLSKTDYNAMVWLEKQNMTDSICVNVDDIGAWVYPIMGMHVANPPPLFVSSERYNYNFGQIQKINNDPNSRDSVLILDEFKNPVVFVSSIALTNGGYTPPFSETHMSFPRVNSTYSLTIYQRIYHDGVSIYKPLQ